MSQYSSVTKWQSWRGREPTKTPRQLWKISRISASNHSITTCAIKNKKAALITWLKPTDVRLSANDKEIIA